jgi:hypothetical protein
MRIDKTIKGEKFRFHVRFLYNPMGVEVKYGVHGDIAIGKFTEDFKYIILPEDYLSPYINGIGKVPVGKLISVHKES